MKKTILILEHDEEIRRIIESRLIESNYEIVCPVDSYVAIEFAQQKNVDLFILNDQMPIINGRETLLILQELQILAPAIVFLSKNNTKTDFGGLLHSTCLQKPFKIDDLLHQVSAMLNR